MVQPALSLAGVTVRYGDRPPAVEQVSLDVGPGERVALLGLNGSGKTTLLLAVAGLLPHEGAIHLCGERLEPRSAAVLRERLGVLLASFEDQLLFPEVCDDVAFTVLRRGVEREAARRLAREQLAALDAGELASRSPWELSDGQKQRVALAGVLVGKPALLLLDEPSAGLDPPAKRGLARHLAAQQAAMLVATHDLDLAGRLCQRFVLLEEGRVAGVDTDLDRVIARWGNDD
jgi:cobalt/nickel transport system ATP-binding protein